MQLVNKNILWQPEYSFIKEVKRPGGKVVSDIPVFPKSLNMLRCKKKVELEEFNKITVSFDINCEIEPEFTRPDIKTNLGVAPESLRICLIRSMYGPYNRWFSRSGVELKRGKFSLSIPIEAGNDSFSEWGSVFGKHPTFDGASLKGFKKCLKSPVEIAIIFGGGDAYGHGICVKNLNKTSITINSLLLS